MVVVVLLLFNFFTTSSFLCFVCSPQKKENIIVVFHLNPNRNLNMKPIRVKPIHFCMSVWMLMLNKMMGGMVLNKIHIKRISVANKYM